MQVLGASKYLWGTKTFKISCLAIKMRFTEGWRTHMRLKAKRVENNKKKSKSKKIRRCWLALQNCGDKISQAKITKLPW